VFEHRLSGNPFEQLEPDSRLAARTSEFARPFFAGTARAFASVSEASAQGSGTKDLSPGKLSIRYGGPSAIANSSVTAIGGAFSQTVALTG
jgi:hypothetical protein